MGDSTSTITVAPTNLDQLNAWDGDEGAYWAEHAEYFDRAISAHHVVLMRAAAITADDRVLDVGCGTGETTLAAASAASTGSALGVDLSSRMLDYARKRAADAGVVNASFLHTDAQIHPFAPASFDVVISRTAAMFFSDHATAFANLRDALAPSGRIVLTVWQGIEGNEWLQQIAGALAAGRDMPLPPPNAGPFALSDPERVRGLMADSGFADVEFINTEGGMWFGNDADDATQFILGLQGWMLQGLDDTGRQRAVDNLHASTSAHETPEGVLFGSSTWTITARRA
jgi:SAM-dependent methyltransferase